MNIRMECARTHWDMQFATFQVYRDQYNRGLLEREDYIEAATECAMREANTAISQAIFNCAPHQGILSGVDNAWNNLDINEYRQWQRLICQRAYIEHAPMMADMTPERKLSYFIYVLQNPTFAYNCNG